MRTACDACHKLKVKCDRNQGSKLPCTRCSKADRDCENSWRGILSTRSRNKKLKVGYVFDETISPAACAEPQILEVTGRAPSESRRLRPALSSSRGLDDFDKIQYMHTASPELPITQPYLPVSDFDRPSLCLGQVTCRMVVLDNLYQEFQTGISASSPLLDSFSKHKHAQQFRDHELILLWTMCYASARSLMPSLARDIEQELTKTVACRLLQTPSTLDSGVVFVQCLLLLALWPVTHTSLASDPSWWYIGHAVSLAYLLGLHEPVTDDRHSIYASSDAEQQLRSCHTWIGCYHVSVLLSVAKGYALLIRDDPFISEVLAESNGLVLSANQLSALRFSKRLEDQFWSCQDSLGSRIYAGFLSIQKAISPIHESVPGVHIWLALLNRYTQLRGTTASLRRGSTEADCMKATAVAWPQCLQLIGYATEHRKFLPRVLPVANTLVVWLFHTALLVHCISKFDVTGCIDQVKVMDILRTTREMCLAFTSEFDSKPGKVSAIIGSFECNREIYAKLPLSPPEYCSTRQHIFAGLTVRYLHCYRSWLKSDGNHAIQGMPMDKIDFESLMLYLDLP